MLIMFKIVITRPIPDKGIRLLQSQRDFNVIVRSKDTVISRKELLKLVKGAHAILSILTDTIDAQVLHAAGPQLKIVANYAVGVDNIDMRATDTRGVIVTNTPVPEMTEAVAEHTFALMLALSRRIVEADTFTRQGNYHGWGPQLLMGTDVYGKTLGIVGMGRIGSAVAQRAVKGFGMKLIYTNPHPAPDIDSVFGARRVSLTQVLKKSDFVSLHVPLLPATRHLISTREFRLMQRSAFLINTARGPIVDEKALVNALVKKQIAGAGVDVFECEPLIDCDPRDTLELRKLRSVIMTPHIASATIEARQAMSVAAAKNIIAALHGKKPPHQITSQ